MLTTIDLEQKNHIQVYKRYPITITEGKGAIVKDDKGKEYLDFLAGIAVNNVGHCHPKVVEAIKNQAEKLIHISNFFFTEPQSELVAKLTEISGFDRGFLCNSGAEAAEAAVKLARKYAYKKGKKGKIVSMTNCFHGRTIAAIAMGKDKYQEGFGPMPEGFERWHFNDLDDLEYKNPDEYIAIMVEPIQGEGGIVPLKQEYADKISKFCKENDILLIADEVQAGFARTGEMFSFKHFGLEPDIIAIAKALGGGFPIGGILATEEVAQAFDYGNHGTTFGGNPLASAAALASINAIIDENMTAAAKEKGQYFMSRLYDELKGIDSVKEIRGYGLMLGVELNFPCGEMVKSMLDKGVITNCAAEYTVRIVPPLIITTEQIDKYISILKESIIEFAK